MTSFQGNSPIPVEAYSIATGSTSTSVFIPVLMTRDPNTNDINYQVKQLWINTTSGQVREWLLIGFISISGQTTANWIQISTGSFSTGLWTPNLQINGSDTGITYSTQTGGFTQISNVVTIWLQVTLSNKGISTGNVIISNLPIPTSTNGINQVIPVPFFSGWTLTNYTSMALNLRATSQVANFVVSGSGQATSNIMDSQITNSFSIFATGLYITD